MRMFTEKGFKKFEADELVDLGKEAGFEKAEVRDVVKDMSLMVIYTKYILCNIRVPFVGFY